LLAAAVNCGVEDFVTDGKVTVPFFAVVPAAVDEAAELSGMDVVMGTLTEVGVEAAVSEKRGPVRL
jgi:hypothetical protein